MAIFRNVHVDAFYLIIGAAIGMLFFALRVPGGVMIGALVIAASIKLLFKTTYHVPWIYTAIAELFLGISLGLSITMNLFVELGQHIILIMFFILLTVLSGVLSGLYLYRKKVLDFPTALYSMVPGAAFQMAVLGEKHGASYGLVSAIHILRMVLVIVIPICIGGMLNVDSIGGNPLQFFEINIQLEQFLIIGIAIISSSLAYKLKIPVSIIIGSMSGVAVTQFIIGEITPLAGFFSYFTQVVIGVALGLSISREVISSLKKIIIPVFITIILMIAFGLGLAWIYSVISKTQFLTALFSFAPGGLTEMTVAAEMLGGDGVLVASIHIARLLLIILVVPALLNWVIKKNKDSLT